MRLLQRRADKFPAAYGVIFGTNHMRSSSTRSLKIIAAGIFVSVVLASTTAFALNRTAHTFDLGQSKLHTSTTLPAISPTDPDTAHTSSTPATCGQATYSLPQSLSASDKSSGVYVQMDPVKEYQVFGSTPKTIMGQIAFCTPVRQNGVFAANTGYSLTNYYTYGVGSDGLCHISTAVVTLRINQIFPRWTNPGNASPDTVRAWNRFSANLLTHEQGHVEFDNSYAYRLYDAMRTIQPQGCSTFKSSVDTAATRVMQDLAAANEQYDITTKHGTTQGAVL
jgi:predicted secreted Zn-dependent protease